MKDFNHPHILCLLGVCFNTPDGSPYIVLPYMANGSLKKYLKEKRVHVLDVNTYPKVLVHTYMYIGFKSLKNFIYLRDILCQLTLCSFHYNSKEMF